MHAKKDTLSYSFINMYNACAVPKNTKKIHRVLEVIPLQRCDAAYI